MPVEFFLPDHGLESKRACSLTFLWRFQKILVNAQRHNRQLNWAWLIAQCDAPSWPQNNFLSVTQSASADLFDRQSDTPPCILSAIKIRFIDSMETVYSPTFFRRFIRIEPFNTGQATFGFICTVGAGFGVCSGRRGRREKTVLTLQLLTIKEGVVPATQAADWSLNNRC